MTPAARLAATIELFEQVRNAALAGGAAADNIIRGYFRQRRYAGSKDRRDITENIYSMLHDYQALAWRIEECGGEVSARSMVLAWRTGIGGDPQAEFTGDGYGAAVLDDAEKSLCARLGGIKSSPPELARLNCPSWLESSLRARFGSEFATAMRILNSRGPVTFRVNALKMSRDEAIGKLELKSADLMLTSDSPWGITLSGESANLRGHPLFRNGALEVQNEASQIASLLVDAQPGMQVLDLCAGAGGKSLALAACMQNKGQIYAADINSRRLGRLKDRCRKAGVRNIQLVPLPENDGTGRKKALRPCLGAMDRVVVDVPCSGTGTWRHNPELRLRADADWLNALKATQQALLDEAAAYVKPGGRLVYMTCSLLAEENEAQVERFLGGHADWAIMPYQDVWREALNASPASSLSGSGQGLQLGPAEGGDGFFVAILKAP